MIDRTETIRRIERSIADWPYLAQCPEYTLEMLKSAQQLLKTDMPRVMTLDEISASQKNDVMWLEDKDKPEVIPGIFRKRFMWPHTDVVVTDIIDVDGRKVCAADYDYSIRWRVWTSRPNDEQRKAVAWNE